MMRPRWRIGFVRAGGKLTLRLACNASVRQIELARKLAGLDRSPRESRDDRGCGLASSVEREREVVTVQPREQIPCIEGIAGTDRIEHGRRDRVDADRDAVLHADGATRAGLCDE